MKVNWYPGHMAKTMRELAADIKLAELVIQIRDARIPISSVNPELDRLVSSKSNIIILNKSDLASPVLTKQWVKHLSTPKNKVYTLSATDKNDVQRIKKEILAYAGAIRADIMKRKGINKTVRAIVVGIPNSGKSTFINSFFGSAKAKTGNMPGVTRNRQWIKAGIGFELLDTPGLLMPNLGDESIALALASTNAIKNELYDTYTLAMEMLEVYAPFLNKGIEARYSFSPDGMEPEKILQGIAKAKSLLLRGGEADLERASNMLVNDFRTGKLGKITLEAVPQAITAMEDSPN